MRLSKHLHVRIDEDTLKKLRELSEKIGISASHIVRCAIELVIVISEVGTGDDLYYRLVKKERFDLIKFLKEITRIYMKSGPSG